MIIQNVKLIDEIINRIMKREVLSDLIYHKIGLQKKSVEKQFSDSSDSIGYFFLLMTCRH
jgi:hypothetical protein